MGRLRRALRARIGAWARRRQGVDARTSTLATRRIYILPTAQGFAFGLMLFVMLLGSMNYNNSVGLAATFGFAGFALVVMHHAHRALVGLVISYADAEPVFAGQALSFRITLHNPSRFRRFDLSVFRDDELVDCVSLDPGESRHVDMRVATSRRGRVSVDRFSIRCRYPAALFQTWAWVYCDMHGLVYPAPAESAARPPAHGRSAGSRLHLPDGQTDFAGLREFRRGDSPRHVAWKSYARSDELRTKLFAGADRAPPWFDWHATRGDTETRLATLCRWIIDAERERQPFGLRLPALTREPAADARHVRACLSALATF